MFKTLRISLVLGFIIALALSALTALPAQASAKSPSSIEKAITPLTNKDRKAKKLPSVSVDKCLGNFAKSHAKTQASKRKMYHQDLKPVLKKCKMRSVGENVAYGYTTAEAVQKAWMKSPGHRKNILTKKFNRIGVGVSKASNGQLYYTVVLGQK